MFTRKRKQSRYRVRCTSLGIRTGNRGTSEQTCQFLSVSNCQGGIYSSVFEEINVRGKGTQTRRCLSALESKVPRRKRRRQDVGRPRREASRRVRRMPYGRLAEVSHSSRGQQRVLQRLSHGKHVHSILGLLCCHGVGLGRKVVRREGSGDGSRMAMRRPMSGSACFFLRGLASLRGTGERIFART